MMILDETFSVLSPGFLENPYQFFPSLREGRPVAYDSSVDGYFISRFDDVRSILRDEKFTTEPLTVRAEPVMRGRVLAQMHGAEHTAKRKIVIRGISGSVLTSRYAPMVRKNTEELISPFMSQGRVDLVNDFGKKFAVYVTLDLLGLPKDDWADIASWHAGVAEFITSMSLSEEQRAHSLKCSEALADYLRPVIEERRVSPGEDYLSALCTATVDGQQMTTQDIIALCMNILLAATEPADKTLALLFRHLIDNPEQFAMVRRDPELLPKAIAETLRYTPPVQLIPRQAAEETMIAGVIVPAGGLVFCMIGSANRDPSAFVDPDLFDVSRPDLDAARSFSAAAGHVAFGTGLHYCVGAAFARVEIEVAAQTLLQVLGEIGYAPGFEYREVGLYTRGPESLLLEFSTR
jgi:pulcherriminic acid synthase